MHEHLVVDGQGVPTLAKCPWMGKVQYLDRIGKVLTCPPKPIGKFTFNCFTSLKEKQLENLVKGSFEKTIVHSMNL